MPDEVFDAIVIGGGTKALFLSMGLSKPWEEPGKEEPECSKEICV